MGVETDNLYLLSSCLPTNFKGSVCSLSFAIYDEKRFCIGFQKMENCLLCHCVNFSNAPDFVVTVKLPRGNYAQVYKHKTCFRFWKQSLVTKVGRKLVAGGERNGSFLPPAWQVHLEAMPVAHWVTVNDRRSIGQSLYGVTITAVTVSGSLTEWSIPLSHWKHSKTNLLSALNFSLSVTHSHTTLWGSRLP